MSVSTSSATPRVFDSVEAFVKFHEGTRVISKILLANNGIAAVKAMRSLRKFAFDMFGDDRKFSFVAMATPEDLAANAEYIRMADHFVPVSGGSNANNYANVDVIIEVAERCAVDAVWVGWGHASENPVLPQRLTGTKIAFIGPPAKPMHELGDKIASTLVAQSVGVSCVPWSGSRVEVDYEKHGITDEQLRRCCVTSIDEARRAMVDNNIKYPIMLKASEGGGGKGIRRVQDESELATALRNVQSEVPGSPIFIMQLVADARHLEIQILADQYGEAVALNGRDCSVQRRHQKIIEEGPPVMERPDIWDAMQAGGVRMAKRVGYQALGTIEFLFTRQNEYYFLEMNPRLQVEHPVTESIMDINLPAAQLMVTMGIPLHRIPDVRSIYGFDRDGTNRIDFLNTKKRDARGHCIAARITGENPDQGFKPTSGAITQLTFRSMPSVYG